MSTDRTLRYRPMPPPPPAETLPDALKEYLGNQLWETEQGSLAAPVVLQADNMRVIGFLEGLVAAQVDGADVLLEAIQEHTTVTVWIGEDDPFV